MLGPFLILQVQELGSFGESGGDESKQLLVFQFVLPK